MSGYFIIEEGVPPPPPRGKHPALLLKPGQSMVVPSHAHAVRARQLINENGYECRSRKLDDDSGIRVWCLSREQGE